MARNNEYAQVVVELATAIYELATGTNSLAPHHNLGQKQRDAELLKQQFLANRAHNSIPCQCYCPTCGKPK